MPNDLLYDIKNLFLQIGEGTKVDWDNLYQKILGKSAVKNKHPMWLKCYGFGELIPFIKNINAW